MSTNSIKINCYVSGSGGNTIVGKSAAEAICKAYPNSKIKIVNLDKMWPGSNLSGFDFYESCHRKGWYGMIFLITQVAKMLLSLNRYAFTKSIEKQINTDKPDLILSSAPFVAPSLLDAAKKSQTPVAVISADYDPALYTFEWPRKAKGLPPHRVCLPYSCYELTSRINQHVVHRNIAFTGYPTRSVFQQDYSSCDLVQFQQELDLPCGKEIIPIQMGSLGGNITLDYVQNLVTLHEKQKITHPIHYPVFCGRNYELVQKLEQFAKKKNLIESSIGKSQDSVYASYETRDGTMSFSIIEFTPLIHKYLALSSGVITKPGPASISEAVSMKVPTLIAYTGGALHWEKVGVKMVDQHGLGIVLQEFKGLSWAINTLVEPSSNQQIRDRITKFQLERPNQFSFDREIVHVTKELLVEGETAKKNAKSEQNPHATLAKKIKHDFVTTIKHVYHLIIRLFQKIGSAFTFLMKKLVDYSFFSGFIHSNQKLGLERRKALIKRGAIPVEGLFSHVSNKPIDALYIPSKSKKRTGNVIVYSAAKPYEHVHPKNYEPFLESGADILLYNPSENTTKAMRSDLKQLLTYLHSKNPHQKIALYGHCLSGHVAASVATDLSHELGGKEISLIVDRGYENAYEVAKKTSFVAACVKSYIQNQFNANGDKKIADFNGRVLFISAVQGKDKLLHYSKTGNFTRQMFEKWSAGKAANETKDKYIVLPKSSGHWTPLDETTVSKIRRFLKEAQIIS